MRKVLFMVLNIVITLDAYAYEGQDPTRPTSPGDYESGVWAGDSQMSSHGLYLSGIFSQNNFHVAVINGKIVHQGESIEGYKISLISKNSVTLHSNANESFELKFNDFNFKHLHQ